MVNYCHMHVVSDQSCEKFVTRIASNESMNCELRFTQRASKERQKIIARYAVVWYICE